MEKSKQISVIIPAAGSSTRLQSNLSKQFVELNGKPLLHYSLEKFIAMIEVMEVIEVVEIVVATNDVEKANEQVKSLPSKCEIKVVSGGERRQDSVYNGFLSLKKDTDFVVIHDVARPLFDVNDLKECLEASFKSGAAVLATPLVDTIKKGNDLKGRIVVENTVKREDLYAIQTPQVFAYSLLKEAYAKYNEEANKSVVTDEASLVELLGKEVDLVIGKRSNIKITYPEDLELAKAILKSEMYEIGSKR